MYTAGNSSMLRSMFSNPFCSPNRSSLAMRLVMGAASLILASSAKSIHSQRKHSCLQKLISYVTGARRHIRYISEFPNAPGWWCCWRILTRDRNSDRMPVSSKTSRTAVSPNFGVGGGLTSNDSQMFIKSKHCVFVSQS